MAATKDTSSTAAPLIDCAKTDDQILIILNKNHSHDQVSPGFSVPDLFKITGGIIGNAALSSGGGCGVGDSPQPFSSNVVRLGNDHDTFVSPLCLLKSIGFQMSSCEASPSDVNSRTEAILAKLSQYSWEAKAVVALAAFALEYGDFWHLAELYGDKCDQLTKGVAILRCVPVLNNPKTMEKRKAAVQELIKLIKCAHKVIECIFSVEAILGGNDPNDVPTLSKALLRVPVHIYWSIYAVVACAIQVNRLITSDKEEICILLGLVQKVETICKTLESQYGNCLNEIEVADNYRIIARELVMSVSIVKLIKILILSEKDEAHKPVVSLGPKGNITDAASFTKDLDGKHVLFFFSSLRNVSKTAVDILKDLYEKVKKECNCEIVWIPIDDKDDEVDALFKKQSSRMPWYAVKHFSNAGRMYLQKVWNCWGSNSVVLVSPQGKLENTNALYLIQKYKMDFFAYRGVTVEKLLEPMDALMKGKSGMDGKGTYRFFCGGPDKEKLAELTKAISGLKNSTGMSVDYTIIKKKDAELDDKFWSAMQILFYTLAHNSNPGYPYAKQVVSTLLSYSEAKGGWVLVTKGFAVVTCGQIDTMATSLAKISEWKKEINKEDQNSFGVCLRKYHDVVVLKEKRKTLDCCELELEGNVSTLLRCPVCEDWMETTSPVKYRCCHSPFPGN